MEALFLREKFVHRFLSRIFKAFQKNQIILHNNKRHEKTAFYDNPLILIFIDSVHKNDVPPRKLVDGNSPSENRKLRPRNLS